MEILIKQEVDIPSLEKEEINYIDTINHVFEIFKRRWITHFRFFFTIKFINIQIVII